MDGLALLAEVTEILTGGIVSIGTAIGTGVSAVAQALFIGAEGGLSLFAILVLIFGACALGFGLSRWILGFISSLGNRNR